MKKKESGSFESRKTVGGQSKTGCSDAHGRLVIKNTNVGKQARRNGGTKLLSSLFLSYICYLADT